MLPSPHVQVQGGAHVCVCVCVCVCVYVCMCVTPSPPPLFCMTFCLSSELSVVSCQLCTLCSLFGTGVDIKVIVLPAQGQGLPISKLVTYFTFYTGMQM